MDSDERFMRALAMHDEAIRKIGLPIWIGAEPTYTDRHSEAPEWLFCALGDEKQRRAERLVGRLVSLSPGSALLRSVGRQYEGEPLPRWSYGVYRRRDATPLWNGPPDPLLRDTTSLPDAKLSQTFARRLSAILQTHDLSAMVVEKPLEDRVVFRCDGQLPIANADEEPLLARPSIHGQHVEGVEVVDELSLRGDFLITCCVDEDSLRVELPRIADVKMQLLLLDSLSRAAEDLQVPAMILAGYPPPIDETVAWMTVTADPAVIEVNMAPAHQATDIWTSLHELECVSKQEGLESYRLQYTGEECDSGGGGQITLGGPSPEESPFLKVLSLLPSLVRYFHQHPALSYLHAFESIGPGSQAPRVDEGVRSALPELQLALEHLKRVREPNPETLWKTFAPFLADASGNTHRAEINIEKLWNPFLGGRGRLGLVEFRSFRMGASAKTTAALAALLRGIVAMLIEKPCEQPMVDWGDELHQRFSLPLFLQADFQSVLADLERSGFGLSPEITQHLLRDDDLVMTRCELGDSRLEIRRAFEFWPLIGDSATQEGGGSRLIDSSTSRLEIRLRSDARPEQLNGWRLSILDWAIPLAAAEDQQGQVRIAGVRYRSFLPQRGLHPTLQTQTPITLTLTHPDQGNWRMTIHNWEPSGEAYPGLPESIADARARRQARCVLESLETPPDPGMTPREEAIGTHVVDLRWR